MSPTAAPPAADPLSRLPSQDDLPYSDGEPMDSYWHSCCLNLFLDSLEQHWAGRKDFFAGGDMFLYFSDEHVFNKDFRGPDFFVALGVDHDKPRKSYIAWEEGGKLPDVIIELASPTTLHIDRGEKKVLYEKRFETSEYFIYDPEANHLEGWRLNKKKMYVPIRPNSNTGRLACEKLGVYIGTWDGKFLGHADRWLRFFAADGSVIPTHGETAQMRADAEKERADAERRNAAAAQEVAAGALQRSEALAAEVARLRAELAALRGSPLNRD